MATAQAATLPQPCADLLLVRGQIETNTFRVNRGLGWYERDLGPRFARELRALSTSGHWIDSGAGQARAQLEYLTASDSRLGPAAGVSRARCTAIGVLRPTVTAELAALEAKGRGPFGGKFRYLEGRYVEQIPADELGSADLITDYYGAVAYAERVDIVLEQLLLALKRGGALWVYYGHPAETIVTGRDGVRREFHEWLATVPGLKVTVEQREAMRPSALRIEKTRSIVVFPDLALTKYEAFNPPAREYVEGDSRQVR